MNHLCAVSSSNSRGTWAWRLVCRAAHSIVELAQPHAHLKSYVTAVADPLPRGRLHGHQPQHHLGDGVLLALTQEPNLFSLMNVAMGEERDAGGGEGGGGTVRGWERQPANGLPT